MPPVSSAPSALKARVLCRARAGLTLDFVLRGEESVIGRDAGLAVPIPLDGVSRRHARILWEGRSYWIEDLGSTNGTFLNGQPVKKERLRHLDVIGLGKKADLIILIREGETQLQKRPGIVRAALVAEGPDAQPREIPLGEFTLGRSTACNIVVDSGAVSQVHAKIERTSDQLVIQDLGSSNGTFVNGSSVLTSPLREGDVVSLAGVESYRVLVEMGEVTSASGTRMRPVSLTAPPEGERPRLSADWKTRFEWNESEAAEIAELHRRVAEKDREREQTAYVPPKAAEAKAKAAAAPKPAPAPKPAAEKAAAAPAPAAEKPAAAPPKAAPPAAAKPAPVAAKPTAAPPPAEPAAAPAAKPAPTAKEPAAAPKAPPATPKPAPAAPPAAPPAAVVAPAPPPAAPAGRIAEVRLSATDLELVATAEGAHELGRAREAPLRVDHNTVSRRHARLIIGADRTLAYIQDLGGANGTWLNGQAVEGVQPIADGDVVRIGQVQLRVTLKRE